MPSTINNNPIIDPQIVDMSTAWRSPRNPSSSNPYHNYRSLSHSASHSRSRSRSDSPPSPSHLPQWLRQAGRRSRRKGSGVLAHGRLKVLVLGAVCVGLGWWVTSAFRPPDLKGQGWEGEVGGEDAGGVYDAASAGVLGEPSGFGKDAGDLVGVEKGSGRVKIEGFIDEEEEDGEPIDDAEGFGAGSEGGSDEPSVKGALSDLHHAVSDKLHSWNPYFNPGQSQQHPRPDRLKSSQSHNRNRTKTSISPMAKSTLTGETIHDGIPEENLLGARVRIGKCSILFNGNSYWERALRTHETHDRIHGYRLHVLRQELLDDVWSKPAYILSLLLRELSKPASERLDWLLWVDSDTVILNPYIPIETFLPPSGGDFEAINLIYSNDWNGLNNGVFPVRVAQWSANLFADIVAYRHFQPSDPLIFRDQSAMDTLLREPRYRDNVIQAPQRWFNAYQGEHNETLAPFQVRRGDLLVHFAGVPDREARLGYWLERAEQHLEDWEVPVKSTSYPAEVRDFWSEARGVKEAAKGRVTEARLKATLELGESERRMSDFGERANEAQRKDVAEKQEALRNFLGDESLNRDVERMGQLTKELEEAAAPLLELQTQAHKVLLKAAHEAIFAGEKVLLDSGFPDKKSTRTMQSLAEAEKRLKELVILPEEKWERKGLQDAVDGVTELTAGLRGSLEKEEKKKQEGLERERLLEEARVQALKEAGEAVVTDGEGVVAGAWDAAGWSASAGTKGAAPTEIDHSPLLAVGEQAEEVEDEEVGGASTAVVMVQGGTAVSNVLVLVTPHPVTVFQTVTHAGDSASAAAQETSGPLNPVGGQSDSDTNGEVAPLSSEQLEDGELTPVGD